MNRSGIASSIAYQIIENVGAKVVTAVLSLVVARILSPEDYGVVAIVSVFIALSDAIVQSGLNVALIQKKTTDELDYNTVFYISLGMSVVVYVALFAISPFVGEFYQLSELSTLIRFQGLAVFVAPFNTIYTAKTRREMKFKLLMVCNLISSIAAGATGVVLAYVGFGVWSLVIQALSQKVIALAMMVVSVKWHPSLLFSFDRGIPLYRFGYKILLSNILNVLSNQVSSLVIGKAFTTGDLAFYQQGSLYPRTITESLNNAVQNVMIVPMSRAKSKESDVRSYARKTSRMVYFAIAPCMFGLAATAQTLVPVLFTDKWVPLVPFLYVYCANYLLYPMLSSGYQVLMALGKSGVYLAFNIVSKISFLVLLFVGAFIFKDVFVIAIFGLLSSSGTLFFNAILLKHYIGYNVFDQALDVGSSLLVAGVMFGIVFSMNYLECEMAVKLALQVVVGFVVYVALSMGFRTEPYRVLVDYIKHKKRR